MNVELIAITHYLRGNNTPEELLERAGRVCYRSESNDNPGKFLCARIRDGHESIIEHASATFEISGISRACSHQLVRHRLASYSQESQYFVDMSDPEWVVPFEIIENPDATAVWGKLTQAAKHAYGELRALGICMADARFVLPNAAATRIVVTMNFRMLRHLFNVRITPRNNAEIREVCLRMLDIIYPYAPSVFGDLWNASWEDK